MRIAQANLITKTDFDTNLSSLNKKITQNKIKHLLVENKLTTLENKIPDVSSLIKKKQIMTLKLLKLMINLLKLKIKWPN